MSEPEKPKDDYIVEKLAKEVAGEKAEALAELDAPKPKEVTASGWWTVRHMVVGVGFTALLIGGGVWVHWLVNAPGYQEGYGQGNAESHGGVGNGAPPAAH